jgi:hypothetical protein
MTETLDQQTKRIEEWITRNPDIPYVALINGTCKLCGQASWTQDRYHWCIKESSSGKLENYLKA